jgi:putative PIG3 family NAD(P)H quinone oxidoreductase
MRAVEISSFGDPGVLRPVERPRPVPDAGEVLIRVAAAGVNRPDVMQRQGAYPPPPGASDVPGLEVAGVIEAMGAAAASATGTPWRAGDRVCALVAGGGYAEFVSAPGVQCLPAPARLDLTDAAAIPETFFTVWTNVFERGRLAPGESLLVHGGSSGIGTCAIQLGRAFGATVFATAGTDEKCAACERLGAARAVNHRREDFVEVLDRATGGRGVDVVLDMVGGPYVTRNLRVLATDGRLLQIAVQQGARIELDLRTVMLKRLTISGSTLRARAPDEKGAIARALYQRVWPLIESGAVRPVVHRTFPVDCAADAHRLMEEGSHIGKIVLIVDAALVSEHGSGTT